MSSSLYSQIAMGLAALFLLLGLVFIGVTVFSTDMYQQEVNQKLNRHRADQIIAREGNPVLFSPARSRLTCRQSHNPGKLNFLKSKITLISHVIGLGKALKYLAVFRF